MADSLQILRKNRVSRGNGNVGDGPALSLRNISKTFPGVNALQDVDFELRSGEVHVLFGENGAGKSTLINIIAGVLRPESGTIELAGQGHVQFRSAQDARGYGIAAMFQEFSLAPDLTVEQNVLLNAEPVRFGIFLNERAARRKVGDLCRTFGVDIDLSRPVRMLSRAEQQIVELCKALFRQPRILILDEPTASLNDRDAALLFKILRRLTAQGVGIIYITHRMAEISEIGDRVTVLRDGHRVATLEAADTSRDQLVELMTGKKLGLAFPEILHSRGPVRLSIRSLTTVSGRVHDVSLEVRAGEIVGLAGLVGSGKSEIARSCFGLESVSAGQIAIDGEVCTGLSPRRMLKKGVCYIPSDRRREGLLLDRTVRENLTIGSLDTEALSFAGFLRRLKEKEIAGDLAGRLQLRPMRLEQAAASYSGGNQQKIVLARAFCRDIRICIFDEPTVGIDVGARAQIYAICKSFVEAGMAILLVSSELSEIINLSNRVYVVRGGTIVKHCERHEMTEQSIVDGFFAE
jgi:ribose transport system ATP-binding protein